MMMSIVKLFVGLVFSLVFATSVNAGRFFDERMYVGLEGSYLTYEVSGLSDDLSLGAAILTTGVYLNDYISLESRLGKSNEKTQAIDGAQVTAEIKALAGGYIKFNARNAISNLSPYFIAGGTYIDGVADSDTDVSYGVGLDYVFEKLVVIDFEWMQYYNQDDLDIWGVSLGVAFRF